MKVADRIKRIVNYIFATIIIFIAAVILVTLGSEYPIVYLICPIVIFLIGWDMKRLYCGEVRKRHDTDDWIDGESEHWTNDTAYSDIPGNIYYSSHDD